MLDAMEVLQELEDLLEESYTELRTRKPGQVQVYEKPAQAPRSLQGATGLQRPPAPPAPKPKLNPLSEFVANTCLLLFLSVLSDRLANQ